MREHDIIERLRTVASHPAARTLRDDAAVWTPPVGRELVLTHDVISAGVHYLADGDPSDTAWKLVAVNLSDLAAMGARPAGVLLGLSLGPAENESWMERFAGGLARVLTTYEAALFGGDTTRIDGPAVLGCTAVGHVPPGEALAREGACAGDRLFVTGTIGDAGLGLAACRGDAPPAPVLERAYRLPMPRLAVGQGLFACGVHAAMDVSDGLLIDAGKMAAAAGLAAAIALRDVPLSEAAERRLPRGDEGRLRAAVSGDDYELLIAAPPSAEPALFTLCERERLRLTAIGGFVPGAGVTVLGADGAPVQAERLGYEHGH